MAVGMEGRLSKLGLGRETRGGNSEKTEEREAESAALEPAVEQR